MAEVELLVELLDFRDVWHPVAQTRRHSWEALPNERGDCHRAALASLLGTALGNVADHAGAHSPADHFDMFGRRWLRDELALDVCWFKPGNLDPGWLGITTVPSLNAEGAWHSVVVEVIDAGAVKVVWDPAQWPGRPNYDGRILPSRWPAGELMVEAICKPYDPSPDRVLADGAIGPAPDPSISEETDHA